ncbi:bifunctional adenosylcobinamide kinase/adenosylcobinamide-phosphate guanylyltransferase [Vibrio kanaloae]|jgi:adenosylcobinamide kinase / adenosylcobinamide-phosphate guanylyltransferase|uniref:bifunctional adenosylcobinamide kinase/adenosylcobinamide-phosphate guanylyltransferase n=1 Tax=Vibrio kanaloae TaxID=170673 RepID=UPI00148DB0AA|nr:bifunctional adenosylcobinamide kinase/adenosylcobinamide-phosphate guanylyltransferase [Vibrio kanaloae]MCG9558070.1 bifunctional adenosylcobinamide kinase/adenosylcobinamide-phosphate guanylyltransferase [Vibrio kanaloae]NOI98654.1 bifunctional adenosylcobinamide kinase/adenosylcobinamide-phosphate guanylyltransferase [Vibrio kanaloae]UIJ42001.1 bifunctional adenosylcobinamide kinase/adenosylcobinamide-phosphate guanylyltransferase [Vibrio kanaloae]
MKNTNQTIQASQRNSHLVLGGARSGKSSYAEQQALSALAACSNGRLHYIATATYLDDEMRERIAHHQQRRGEQWIEHEVPVELAEKLQAFNQGDVVLIDCLTLWLNNLIFELGDDATNEQVETVIEALVQSVEQSPAQIIIVSNEVGLGVVPLGKVSRLFVDNAGRMNQALARVVERVTLVTAGLPLILKPSNY